MRLSELAERLGCTLDGRGDIEIRGVAPIESAEPGEVTFVANPRYGRYLSGTRASAVILARDAPKVAIPSLRTAEPYVVFADAIRLFFRPVAFPPGIHATAVVAESAVLGPGACVGAYSVIGENVRIGAEARIGPHVVIYPEVSAGDRLLVHAQVTIRERVRIGHDVILHSGVVLGSDGFGYVVDGQGRVTKIPQAGDVVVEDGVEIGANTTVDRATVGSTYVRRGAKLDNLVQVAHGCDVGENAMLAAQTGLAGSTKIGRWVRMGGQTGSAGHLTIGDGAQVAAQSGVANSVAAGATVGGTPAVEMKLWRRSLVGLRQVPDALRRLRRIEKALGLGGAEEAARKDET